MDWLTRSQPGKPEFRSWWPLQTADHKSVAAQSHQVTDKPSTISYQALTREVLLGNML